LHSHRLEVIHSVFNSLSPLNKNTSVLAIDDEIPLKIENLSSKEHHLTLEVQSEMFSLNNAIENLCFDLTKDYNIAKAKLMDKIYCYRNVKNWVQIFKASEDLLSMNPRDYVAMTYKGEALLEIGRTKEADLVFEKVFSETEGKKDPEIDFARGRAHFTLKEYSLAAKCFGNASHKNHTAAQFNLGWMYSHGIHVPKNNILAAKLYYKAAQNGFANAQYNLGVLYYIGIGLEQNHEEAVAWYYKAAKKGLAMAQSNLAVCYFEGMGTRVDRDQAIRLYILSATQGLTSAQFNLGTCYYQGSGVTRNYTEAYKWFMKAAMTGLAGAQYQLGKMYEHGFGTEKDSTESKYWYQKAASQNHEKAIEALKMQKQVF
jgi:TPR repeat protein